MQVALRVRPAAAALSASALSSPLPSAFVVSRRGMASSRDVRMRVILRNDSELGAAHEVIAVRRGFGRKVLIKKGMADYATAENLHYSAAAKLAAKEAAIAAAAAGVSTPQQIAAQLAQGEAGEGERAAASAAAASAASLLLLSPEAARHAQDSVRRLGSQRPLLFVRPSGDLRDQTNLAVPLRLRDVYAKLVVAHPSLSVRQLRFEGAGTAPDAIAKFGEYKVLISMPGAPQPVPIAITVKRDATKVGATIPVAAAATAAKGKAARA